MTAALPKSARAIVPQPTQAAASPLLEAPETRILLEGVSWETCERLLLEIGQRSALRELAAKVQEILG